MLKVRSNLTALLKSQEQTLRDAVSFAIETAQKAGATAEVGVTKVSGLSVSTRLQEIENVEFTNDGALGISVYLGQQKGNASTSDLSEEAIKNTVEAALASEEMTKFNDLSFYEELCKVQENGLTGLQNAFGTFYDIQVAIGSRDAADRDAVLAAVDASYLEKAIAMYKELHP